MQKNVTEISYFLRTRTPGLKMAAVKIQHKNCLQSTLWKKKMNTLFAGLGRSVLGKNCALGLEYGPRTQDLCMAQFFPIRTSRPYIHLLKA